MSLVVNVHHKAAALVALFGVEARTIAASTADRMLSAGNVYERRTWRRILEAVDELLSQTAADPDEAPLTQEMDLGGLDHYRQA